MEPLTIETSREGDDRIVRLRGEVDLNSVPSLIRTLQRVTDDGDSVVIDMHGVRYIDSQGVRALRNAHQQSVVSGGRLQIRGTHGMVDRILRTVGLDRIVPMADPAPPESTE